MGNKISRGSGSMNINIPYFIIIFITQAKAHIFPPFIWIWVTSRRDLSCDTYITGENVLHNMGIDLELSWIYYFKPLLGTGAIDTYILYIFGEFVVFEIT